MSEIPLYRDMLTRADQQEDHSKSEVSCLVWLSRVGLTNLVSPGALQ